VSQATFASTDFVPLQSDYNLVVSKTLPVGNWAIQANAITNFGRRTSSIAASDCQLRKNGTDVIGGAADQRVYDDAYWATLPMNGGLSVPSGSATVSVWCRGTSESSTAYPIITRVTAQIMAIQIGSFF
jgi:hypothetical protein